MHGFFIQSALNEVVNKSCLGFHSKKSLCLTVEYSEQDSCENVESYLFFCLSMGHFFHQVQRDELC